MWLIAFLVRNWNKLLSLEIGIIDHQPISMLSMIWGVVNNIVLAMGWCIMVTSSTIHIHSLECPWLEGDLISFAWGGKNHHSLARKASLERQLWNLVVLRCHGFSHLGRPHDASTWLSFCVRCQILVWLGVEEAKGAWLTNQEEGVWASRSWKPIVSLSACNFIGNSKTLANKIW